TGAVKKPKDDNENKKKSEENAIVRYVRETRGEMRKVTWPTRDEATRLTLIVLAVTAAFAVFLGLVDLGWSTILEQLIRFIVGA
ncbi:MAG: preprotein translocase subunit SecE, partial [Anaerolineales bacterium]|nr:preprotein translocase subunit SecE [Anaerolineales bacterium]